MTPTDFGPDYELWCEGVVLPKNLEEALRLPLFQGGTMDLFIDERRYRVAPCYASYVGESIKFLHDEFDMVTTRVWGDWQPTLERDFSFTFRPGASARLLYGKGDKRVILFAFSDGTHGAQDVRVVLYPNGRPPTSSALRIVSWRDNHQPLFNGGFQTYIAFETGSR